MLSETCHLQRVGQTPLLLNFLALECHSDGSALIERDVRLSSDLSCGFQMTKARPQNPTTGAVGLRIQHGSVYRA